MTLNNEYNERLPAEDAENSGARENEKEKTVRLTIYSKQIVGKAYNRISLFADRNKSDEFPEGYSPDAISDTAGYYTADDFDDDFDSDFDDDFDGDFDNGESPDVESVGEVMQKINSMFGEILKSNFSEADENVPWYETEDVYVMHTDATLRRTLDMLNRETLEIIYKEEAAMDDTNTVITYTPSLPGMIGIVHDGSVTSSLVCELGRRNISVYETPVMPFEMALYTKKLDGGFSFEEGGTVELDYLVELRGMDVQRTRLLIVAEIV